MPSETVVVDDVVLAGQIFKDEVISGTKKKIILGPGLFRSGNDIVICKCGILRKKPPNVYWVECPQKRYGPAKDESVVGVITSKAGDYFMVDIGASVEAILHFMSFEGATKKYRPDLSFGDVVYGRLNVLSQDIPPELICMNKETGRKEGYGKLTNDGFLISTSLQLVRKILNPKCHLLSKLGEVFKFECAIGMNGKVWLKSEDISMTIAVSNAILTAETMDQNQISRFCNELTNKYDINDDFPL